MTIDTIKDNLGEYAKDIRLNISTLLGEEILTETQRYGVFLVSAYATKNAAFIRDAEQAVDGKLSDADMSGIKAAATIMAMNNIYYRFTHLVSSKDYQTMPAKLRMNIMANPGIEKMDFEIYSLAVSAITGCGMCVDTHEKTLRKHEVSAEKIQQAIRIAATVNAAAQSYVIEGK